MRQDMAKVIVERPRQGGSHKYRDRRSVLKEQVRYIERTGDLESDRLESGTESFSYWASRMLGYDRKELNENLQPLKRFMLSRVGRVWDEVFSEICEVMDVRSACQYHIWQHAKDYVEENTCIGDDGGVWFACAWGSRWLREDMVGNYRPIKDSFAVVYVDPRDGILREVPDQWTKRNFRKPSYDGRVIIDQWNQAHLIGEHWFWIELAPIEKPYWKPWTEKEKIRVQEEVIAARSAKYYYFSQDARDYRRSAAGRWIYPRLQDCALYSIIQTWQGKKYDDWKDSGRYRWGTAEYDTRSAETIYGRKDVYAIRRWQMNTDELRRYGIKPIREFPEGPEVI